jgi:D-alanyl-D-alanine carboxypeptidase/D-alanyl-D-alanine-endopeptidase (penicillin-binding protein 4)
MVRSFVLLSAIICLITSHSPNAPSQPDLTTATRLLDQLQAKGVAVSFVLLDPTGRMCLAHNEQRLVKPASNNKLFTSAAALELLGPDFRTTTTLQMEGTLNPNGVLQGNLWIVGGGDPTISGRFEADSTDSTAPLRRLADGLTSAGIKRITGDLIVDNSLFGNPAFHPLWPASERGEWYSAEVSALSFNDNCVDLAWSARGVLPGSPAHVDMVPDTRYVELKNQVIVTAKGRPAGRSYRRGMIDNVIEATGQIPVDAFTLDSAAVHNGAMWFGTVLHNVMTSQGLQVDGTVRESRMADASGDLKLVLALPSPPLSRILEVINRNSQNFYAESVVRLLGVLPQTRHLDRESTGVPGSWERGTSVASLAVAGILDNGARPTMVDGSGLSHQNRTTALQLAQICWRMSISRHQQVWKETLAVGATRGSLRTRFRQTSASISLASRIYGKTGLIAGVRALSGHIETKSGPFPFSLVLNDIPAREASSVVRLMDELVLEVAQAVVRTPTSGLHPLVDAEPISLGPLNVQPRTTPVSLPDPPPAFAAGKILNETSRFWFARLKMFELELTSGKATSGGVVLLGDSLTERFPTQDLLPNLPVINRGIGGDKIGGSSYLGIRDRLPVSVTSWDPAVVVLLVGTNDIMFARTDFGNMQRNYRMLVEEIKLGSPRARLVLVTLPPGRGQFQRYNFEVVEFNRFIRGLAHEEGLTVVDLYDLVKDDQGELTKHLTNDNLHLSEDGYRIYARALRPILRSSLKQSPFQRTGRLPSQKQVGTTLAE